MSLPTGVRPLAPGAPGARGPDPSTSRPANRTPTVLAAGLFLLCAAVYYRSPVHEVADSHYSMLLSEQIWRSGSFELDRYFQHPDRHWPEGTWASPLSYHVYRHNGHIYYFYPPGSSVLSIPLVIVEGALGLHASDDVAGYSPAREQAIERINAALLTAVTIVLLFFVARHVLDDRRAAALALIAAFGTGLFSTASRVMWTHTWGVCLLSAALLLLVRGALARPVHPVLLATLLSWLYFTRPTFSISIVGVTLYVLFAHPRAFCTYAITGAAWFAGLVWFSQATSDGLLPPYFRLGSVLSLRGFPEGMAGVLVSPSRGLLVYSPVTIAAAWLAVRARRRTAHAGLLVLAAAMSAGHLIAIGLFPTWAGGACYGARYATDAVPWMFLLGVLGLRTAIDSGSCSPLARAATAVLIAASVLVQAPGAMSHTTWLWNLNQDPRHVWDWSDPQFWHWELKVPGFLKPLLSSSPRDSSASGSSGATWSGRRSGRTRRTSRGTGSRS